MEFCGNSIQGLEMYTPLRVLNVPAELVIYEGETHNFASPKARIASMARKVDWLNYWLLDKRGAGKVDQYARWDQMKEDAREIAQESQSPLPKGRGLEGN